MDVIIRKHYYWKNEPLVFGAIDSHHVQALGPVGWALYKGGLGVTQNLMES